MRGRMGTMSFQLPPGLPAEMVREVQLACLAGGFDNAPGPTQTRLHGRRLTLQRAVDESGFLIIPWEIEGAGRMMTSTATLIERTESYSLAVELARGKVNQIRNHVAELRPLGIQLTPDLEGGLQELNHTFGRVLSLHPSDEADEAAQQVMRSAFRFSEQLVPHYAHELFRIRHQRLPRLNTALACQLIALPPDRTGLMAAFTTLRPSLNWRFIEPLESQYNWEPVDAILDWAEANRLPVVAGPLIDFSSRGIPDWLWIWEGDLSNLANFMCDYVETVIARYRRRIKRWLLATGCNIAGVLGLGEDDLLWLTARLVEAAQQIAPDLELILGVSQPWADYMARDEHTYTPLVFLDTLMRTGLKLAALDIELVMGITPGGSYCRDLLEVSRLLDSFAQLSTPIEVTLAVPSAAGPDPHAAPRLSVGLGNWKHAWTPSNQAEYGGRITELALSKPFVSGVCWSSASDAIPHHYPHCGVFDAEGRAKPLLQILQRLRQSHLR